MINDDVSVTGTLGITLRKSDGSIKEEHTFKNLVVTVGKEFIASRVIDDTTPQMSEMGVGTSDTSLDVTNTALASELATAPITSATVSGNVITFVSDFASGVGTGAIVEAGIFDGESAPTMLCRTTFPVINKESDDILTINWNVTIN